MQDALISLQRGKMPPMLGMALPINGGFWAVGNGEGYLHVERDVYGNLWEQVQHLQCKAQAGIVQDALTLC